MAVSPYLSIITLNVNGLNSPIKIHRIVEWIKKIRLNYMQPARESLQLQRHTDWKWRDIKDSKCMRKQRESRGSYTQTKQPLNQTL